VDVDVKEMAIEIMEQLQTGLDEEITNKLIIQWHIRCNTSGQYCNQGSINTPAHSTRRSEVSLVYDCLSV
jgi:hypothetical protein